MSNLIDSEKMAPARERILNNMRVQLAILSRRSKAPAERSAAAEIEEFLTSTETDWRNKGLLPHPSLPLPG